MVIRLDSPPNPAFFVVQRCFSAPPFAHSMRVHWVGFFCFRGSRWQITSMTQ